MIMLITADRDNGADDMLQVSYDDFKEFASLRKELHKLQVALEFYQQTTGHFCLDDLKVNSIFACWCCSNPFLPKCMLNRLKGLA